jgi:hypothetical protein
LARRVGHESEVAALLFAESVTPDLAVAWACRVGQGSGVAVPWPAESVACQAVAGRLANSDRSVGLIGFAESGADRHSRARLCGWLAV